jgi:hypothetical protein
MSAHNDVYVATVKQAGVTKLAAVAAVEMTKQSLLASGNVAGAAAAVLNGYDAAERAKQPAFDVARDLLRSQGELPT